MRNWKHGTLQPLSRNTLYWFGFRWCWRRWRDGCGYGSRWFGFSQDHGLEGSACDCFNNLGHLRWKLCHEARVRKAVIMELSTPIEVQGKMLSLSKCFKSCFSKCLVSSPETNILNYEARNKIKTPTRMPLRYVVVSIRLSQKSNSSI